MRQRTLGGRLEAPELGLGCMGMSQFYGSTDDAQSTATMPIPGTKRRTYLEQNIAATEVELTPEDLATLGAAAPPGVAAGERYPAEALARVNL